MSSLNSILCSKADVSVSVWHVLSISSGEGVSLVLFAFMSVEFTHPFSCILVKHVGPFFLV